jgi:hypothetical protein
VNEDGNWQQQECGELIDLEGEIELGWTQIGLLMT